MHPHTRKRQNGGRRWIKQFSQSWNPVSCPGPHNLHHSGGHSERDSLTVERTESPNVCHITSTPWRLTERTAAAIVSWHKMALGDERNCLGVWISQFRICPVWEYACNPQRKTTLRKQPHDRLRLLHKKAGFSHLVCTVVLTEWIIFLQRKEVWIMI